MSNTSIKYTLFQSIRIINARIKMMKKKITILKFTILKNLALHNLRKLNNLIIPMNSKNKVHVIIDRFIVIYHHFWYMSIKINSFNILLNYTLYVIYISKLFFIFLIFIKLYHFYIISFTFQNLVSNRI